MSRPGTLQVALDTTSQFAVEALATKEERSMSGMAALLIREALRARGVPLAAERPYQRPSR